MALSFTKTQAVEALKAKVPAKDKELDLERTISEVVDNYMEFVGEDSEMELNDFVEKAWKSVKTSIGLAHNENSKVAQKLKDQIADLQAKIGGKQEPQKNVEKVKSDDPTLQALLDKLNKMEEKLNANDKAKSIEEKRTQLAAKMGESIKDKDWIDAYLAEINVTEETDVEAKAKDYVAFYNKTQAGSSKRSVTPKAAGGGDDDETKQVKSVVAAAAQIKKTMSARSGGSPVVTEKQEN